MSRRTVFFPLAFLSLIAVMTVASLAADGSPVEQILPSNSKMCAECHEGVYSSFMHNMHARLREFEFHGTPGGCESCHGPAQRHMESNDPADIFVFGQHEVEVDNAQCRKCHDTGTFSEWAHGAHAQNGLACTECHTIHKGKGEPPQSFQQMELCAKCHADVRAQMLYPSHHPVREGKMSCASCHNVHGRMGDSGLNTEERKSDLCLECHARYQGPFIFEHQPVVEDCMICHNPHGAIADNLLKQNEPFLCLQCHSLHFHTARIGETGSTSTPTGETITNRYGREGMMRAFATKCTQCHIRIHGSDVPSQATSGHGGGLTR